MFLTAQMHLGTPGFYLGQSCRQLSLTSSPSVGQCGPGPTPAHTERVTKRRIERERERERETERETETETETETERSQPKQLINMHIGVVMSQLVSLKYLYHTLSHSLKDLQHGQYVLYHSHMDGYHS